MCYKDAVNNKSNQKNIGIIKSSNLCVEINLYSDSNEMAVCNLASICLSKFVELNDLQNSNNLNVVVYSKDNCKYCTLAKDVLNSRHIQFSEVLLNDTIERINFYEQYTDEEEGTIVNSMPQIFINYVRIGGYDELLKYINKYSSPSFNYDKLGLITETIVENLNCIIDKNYYPTNGSRYSNLKHRPIGIGVQGLADVFIKMNLSFTSLEARKLNKNIFETIYYYALKKSCELSKIHGSYETFIDSPAYNKILQFDMWNKIPEFISIDKWNALKDDICKYGIRNSTLISLMPTASTAQIMGNNESFEPYTSNIYVRKVLSGEFIVINKHLVNYLRCNNLYTKEIIDQIILHKGSVQHLNLPQNINEILKRVL